MVKNHLKRLAAPKTWKIKRKGIKFITRPNPGPHNMKSSMPLKIIIKDILHYAKNTREIKKILQDKVINIDGIRRKDHKFPVGLFDIIEIPSVNVCYRIVYNKRGKLDLLKTEKNEANIKPCKIVSKSKVGKKTQLNLYDGKNILVEEDSYKVGDTIITSLPNLEIKECIKFEKGAFIYLIGGKHMGDYGRIEDIISNNVRYKKDSGESIETLKGHVFVLGKDNPKIKLSEK